MTRVVKKKARTREEIVADLDVGSKVCGRCLERKWFENFSNNSKSLDGKTSQCKSCEKHSNRNYTPKDLEKRARKMKEKNVKANYGISLEEYEEKMNTSDSCQICGENGKLVFDHCHSSLNFRGTLCNSCNFGLGHFKDNVKLLEKAIQYLEAY